MCRFENKKTMPPVMKPGNEFLPIFSDSFAKSFRLEIDRIKVHPNSYAFNGFDGTVALVVLVLELPTI